jgi:thiol-disulfide isomerase/thioredoxin
MRSPLLFAVVALGCSAGTPPPVATVSSPPGAAVSPPSETAAASLVGTAPDEWQAERWLNSPPLHLADLRGKVVLVRWWTADCPFCSATAPALRRFDRDYGGHGLVVVGMYHHKGADPFDPRVYEDTSKKYGFTFPVAFDPSWSTLKSWLRGVDTGFTSVTFLLDKKGVVRRVHPGGQYVQGDAGYAELRASIEELLAEKGEGAPASEAGLKPRAQGAATKVGGI